VSSVPKPLIAVLAVTAVFFALWTVALKHTLTGSGGAGSSSSSTPAYQSAINKARGLQSLVNSAAAKAGGTPERSLGAPTDTAPASTPGPQATAPRTPVHSSSPNQPAAGASTIASTSKSPQSVGKIPASHPAAGPTGIALVGRALREHKVLALLFYNPAAPDDQAVHREMSIIPTQGGKVVKLAVPVNQLGRYASLLDQIPVNFSPTLVVINHDRQAEEIAGFADSFEIVQRVAAALASPLPKH
jgi:hypothetical protein